jgi:hypothetical protein
MSKAGKAPPASRDLPHAISLSALIALLPPERQRRIEAEADRVLREFYAAQRRKQRAAKAKQKRAPAR